jgi:hypothetical protein
MNFVDFMIDPRESAWVRIASSVRDFIHGQPVKSRTLEAMRTRAHFIFHTRHAAEFAQRRPARLPRAHPLPHVLLDLHLEMRADILLQIPFEPSLEKQPA